MALSRINEILAKIDEVCDDARMAGVEKVRRIKEEVANARELESGANPKTLRGVRREPAQARRC